jgi:hypothetical protein
MTYPNHTYYLPQNRQIIGPYANDKDTVALLYAAFMRKGYEYEARSGDASWPKRYDGSSIWEPESPETSRIRVVVGCGGKGNEHLVEDYQ